MSRRKIPPSSSRAADADEDDLDAFRRAVAGAKPLRIDTVEPLQSKSPPRARFRRKDERQVLVESLQADIDASNTNSGDALFFHHPSVTRKTMRRLARGDFSVQNEIDLHGLTSAESEAALREFILRELRYGHTCVRIIHGKGLRSDLDGPILKQKVDYWLRRWEPVLAFVSARQKDGGTGAIYVLLREN